MPNPTKDVVREDLFFMDPEIDVRGPFDGRFCVTGPGTAEHYTFYLAKAYHEAMIEAIWKQRNGKRISAQKILDDVIERLETWECI